MQLSLDLEILDDHPENLVGDKVYDSDPLDAEVKKRGVGMIRALPEVPDTPEDARRSPPAQVQTALDRRVVFRLASVGPSRPHPMGITRLKLTWIRPVRGYMPAAQATYYFKKALQILRTNRGVNGRTLARFNVTEEQQWTTWKKA